MKAIDKYFPLISCTILSIFNLHTRFAQTIPVRWMIESDRKAIPTKEFKDSRRVSTLTNINLPSLDNAETIENIYDIVEKLQIICSKMNSYFGKKVCLELRRRVKQTNLKKINIPQVIFTILTAFICLTVQLFYIINNIRHGFQSENSVLASAASCSLIFTHVLELWIIFISGNRVKDMWTALINRLQSAKRRFVRDEIFKTRIDELVSIMVFTRVELKAAGLFPVDLSVVTSVRHPVFLLID